MRHLFTVLVFLSFLLNIVFGAFIASMIDRNEDAEDELMTLKRHGRKHGRR